ncbi:uncharacterized protein LOC135367495 [Ornithodoros turicata]|uniref:uncharacterized protein LOC135367495 n=1 Tax=Ornithodoros turicata TaxID=34597 RepID=UPI0031390758
MTNISGASPTHFKYLSQLTLDQGMMVSWNAIAKSIVHFLARRPTPEFYMEGKFSTQLGKLVRLFQMAHSYQPFVYGVSVAMFTYGALLLGIGMLYLLRQRCHWSGAECTVDVTPAYVARFWTYVKLQVLCIACCGMWMLALYSATESLQVGMKAMDTAEDNIQHDLRVFFEEMAHKVNYLAGDRVIPTLSTVYEQLRDGSGMARTVLKILIERGNISSRAFLFEGRRFQPTLEAILDDLAKKTDGSVLDLAKKYLEHPAHDLDFEISKVYTTATEEISILKSAQRKTVWENIHEVIEDIEGLCRKYTQDTNDTLGLIGSFNVLHSEGSVLDFKSMKLFSNLLLMGSYIAVACVEAGMILGFLLGAFNYKEVVPPNKRNAMSNMGGTVLHRNIGAVWFVCCALSGLVSVCFLMASLLETYICSPFRRNDYASLDLAAEYVFVMPAKAYLSRLQPSSILQKCNSKRSYASMINVSFYPLERLNVEDHRARLVENDQGVYLPGLLNQQTLKSAEQKAEALVKALDADSTLSSHMKVAAKRYPEFNIFARRLLKALRLANRNKESVEVDVERVSLREERCSFWVLDERSDKFRSQPLPQRVSYKGRAPTVRHAALTCLRTSDLAANL